MSQGGTIVCRKAKTFIPNAYAELLLAANPNGWGAATVTTEDGVQSLQLNSDDEGMSLELLQETMKTFPDQDITFYFANSSGPIDKADLPPYILLSNKEVIDNEEVETPLIVGFVDGNFPGYAKADSSHPPEHHLVEDYLIPKFQGLADMCDGDLNKITDMIQKPFFKKELLLNAVSRGTITLVAANGVAVTFNQGDKAAEYPWGWVSNSHGYAEGSSKKQEEKKPEKPKSAFPSRSTVREKVVNPPNPEIAAAVEKPKTEATVIKNYTVKKMSPPGHYSRKDKKGWYQSRLGYAPPGWERSIAVDVAHDPTGKLMTIGDIKKLGAEAIKVFSLMKGNPQRGKDTEADEIEHDQTLPATTEKPVSAEILPIMSPKTRDHIKVLLADPKVKKIIAENAEQIMDPAKMKAFEAKFSDFATQLGAKTIYDCIPMSYEMIYSLCKDRPDGGAVLAFSLQNIVMASKAKKVTAEEVHQLAHEELKPQKRSMFPSRRTA